MAKTKTLAEASKVEEVVAQEATPQPPQEEPKVKQQAPKVAPKKQFKIIDY
jgi:hypothetical protein